MDSHDVNVDRLKFTARNIEFKFWIKLRAFFVGFFGRGAALRVFCQKNKIDYPVVYGKHYALPDKYQIEHSEIVHIAKIRDRIIQGLFEGYKKVQESIDEEIKNIEAEIKNDFNVLENEKKQLEEHKKTKASTKNPQLLLSVNSWISTSKTAIQNLENDINSKKALCNILKETKVNNIESWKQQIDIVCAAEDVQNHDFVLNLTRKITKTIGFKEFSYIEVDFSNSVKKIKDGGYNA